MIKLLLSFSLLFVYNLLIGQVESKRKFYFENNQYDLSMEQRLNIKELIDSLGKEHFVQILGYANKLGEENTNLILSQKRAEVIRDFLFENNFSKSNIELRFFGENFAQESLESIVESRRVDLIISKNSTVMENPFNPKVDVEIFKIDATKDTTIICKKGVKIFIKAGSFINPNTEDIPENVEIAVQEFLSMTDILENELTTRSNGRVLESGGMINIGATENSQRVELKKGKEIKISFPCKDCRTEMRTFVGEKSNGQINWLTSDNKLGKIESRETKPIFAEGKESINHFILLNRKYPNKAFEKSIEGIVHVRFIIDENGNTLEAKLVKSVEASLDKEAMRIVSILPKWTPAKIDGMPIESKYTLPISFKITKEPFGNNEFTSLGGDIDDVSDKKIDSIKRDKERRERIERKQEMQEIVALGYYVINSSKLGWINVDKYDSKSSTNFIVDANTIEPVKVYVILKNQKSLFSNEYRENSKFNFRQISNNVDIYVLAVKSDNGQLLVSLNESNTALKSLLINEYKESTLQELKMIVQKLNFSN